MRVPWRSLPAALCCWLAPALAQVATPPPYVIAAGMPARQFAPAALVFFADPYSSMQDQRVWVNYSLGNGQTARYVDLTIDPACRSWLSQPYPWQVPTELRVTPGAPGTYTCRVEIERDAESLGSLSVTLNVGSGTAGTTAGIAAPTRLNFSRLSYGDVSSDPQSLTVNASSYYATLSPVVRNGGMAFGDAGLATVTPSDGKLTVQLPTYVPFDSQQLYIETAAGVEVVRIAIVDRSSPFLAARPAVVNVRATGGVPVPDVSLTVSEGANPGVPLSATSSAAWVKVTPPAEATTPATYTLSFDTSVLPNGLNTATVDIRSPHASSISVPVVVLMSGSSAAAGTLLLGGASLSFTATAGGATPLPQSITVGAASAVNYTAVASTQSGGAWLRVVPPGALNTGTTALVQVGVDITGLAAGVYQGAITFAAPGTSFSRAVPVTLTVSAAAAPPVAPSITAVPASLSFSYRAGDALPDARVLQVAGTAGLPFTATASSDGDWLSVSPASASIAPTTSLTVSINAKAAALAAGPHSGSVVLSGGTSGPSVSVPVSLSVAAPLPTITGVVNAASYAAGAIAAGEIVTIFGARLGSAAGQGLTLDAEGNVAKSAGGVQVLVAGFAAPVLYASERQVSAIVPYEIASPFVAQPSIVVKYGGQSSNGYPATQASAAPALFTADSSGAGHAAALNADFSPNSADRPAAPGEVVQLFVTGEGQTTPAGVSGKVTTVASQGPLTPQPLLRVAVTIDGLPAKVLFYGEAPGIVAGMMQINVEVPADARTGEAAVVVTLGSGSDAHETQPGVTVSIR